jgi:hypothetical protein
VKFLRRAQLGWSYYRLISARIAFWLGILAIVFLAVIVIRPTAPPRDLGYAELTCQIDAGNVARASFVKSKDRTVIQGELRSPTESFSTAISNDQMEIVTVRLRNRGESPETSTEIQHGSLAYWGAIASVALFLVAYFLIVRFSIERAKRRLLELKNKEG